MDLFCPHCSRRVSVPDDKAGQAMSCLVCTKQFMAPALAPPPVAPKPPAPLPVSTAPVETYGMGPATASTPTSSPPPPTPKVSKPEPAAAPPAAPPPPGDYTRSCVCCVSEGWLAFVPPVCLVLIFFLSFFTWHNIDLRHTPSLWGMGWVEQKIVDEELKPVDVKQAHFLAYSILIIPCLLLGVACVPFDKGWIAPPPPLAPLMMFANLLLGLLLGLTFLLLCFDFIDGNILQRSNPITLPLKIAFRLHLAAMLASFGMFWLHWRKKSNLPSPKCEVRW
jgi:hypothetical protein